MGMKTSIKLGIAAIMILGSVTCMQALPITPASGPVWTGTKNSNLNANAIEGVVGTSLDLTELYKQNVGGGESGGFASSYVTTFFNSASDPSGALIDYTSGPAISGYEELYLYVKDGNHQPAFYVFDISQWNGTDDLTLSGFWPQNGAISHVTILGGGTSKNVPDRGATVALLGLALGAIGLVRRKLVS
jgi:hypothetical protein